LELGCKREKELGFMDSGKGKGNQDSWMREMGKGIEIQGSEERERN
jgi:hypothetical protein